MASDKLKQIFLLSLLLVYAHGVEEIMSGFQYSDLFMVYGANLFSTTTEVFYWTSHLIWWISLPVLFLLLRKSRSGLSLMSLYGLVFFIELHHPIKGLLIGSYYPGMVTALFYPVFGFFYWKQIIKDWKAARK